MVFLAGLDDSFAFADTGTCNGPDDIFDLPGDDSVAVDGGIEADNVEKRGSPMTFVAEKARNVTATSTPNMKANRRIR